MKSIANVTLFHTVCPRNLIPFYKVTYYINWVKTSWTYSKKNRIPRSIKGVFGSNSNGVDFI